MALNHIQHMRFIILPHKENELFYIYVIPSILGSLTMELMQTTAVRPVRYNIENNGIKWLAYEISIISLYMLNAMKEKNRDLKWVIYSMIETHEVKKRNNEWLF